MHIVLCALHPRRTDPPKRFGESLAIASLKSYLTKDVTLYRNLTVTLKNYYLGEDALPDVADDLYLTRPDLIGFSAYIWNAQEVTSLARFARKVLPQTTLVLGGPSSGESHTSDLLAQGLLDFIVVGEGEVTFYELARALWNAAGNLEGIRGIRLLMGGRVTTTPPRVPLESLDEIPSPLLGGIVEVYGNDVVLWELGRGCPYQCSFCFDNRRSTQRVRYVSLPRAEEELRLLVRSGVPFVDIIDSTFNLKRTRAHEILRLLVREAEGLAFNIEARAELLDEETADLLNRGNFQVYVGLQSADRQVNRNVRRAYDPEAFSRNLLRLHTAGKRCRFAIDLIYGLPGDSYAGFKRSVDFAFSLNPDAISCQPLQVLPETTITGDVERFGLDYVDDHAFQHRVIRNATYPPDEMLDSRLLARAIGLLTAVPHLFALFPHLVTRLGQEPSGFLEPWTRWLRDKQGLSYAEVMAEAFDGRFFPLLWEFTATRLQQLGREELLPLCQAVFRWLELLQTLEGWPSVEPGPEVGEPDLLQGRLRLAEAACVTEAPYDLAALTSATNLHARREIIARMVPGRRFFLLYRLGSGTHVEQLSRARYGVWRALTGAIPTEVLLARHARSTGTPLPDVKEELLPELRAGVWRGYFVLDRPRPPEGSEVSRQRP